LNKKATAGAIYPAPHVWLLIDSSISNAPGSTKSDIVNFFPARFSHMLGGDVRRMPLLETCAGGHLVMPPDEMSGHPLP
jgi:hypothetical protein